MVTIEEKLAVAKGGIIHVCGGYFFGKTFELSVEGGRDYLTIKDKEEKFVAIFPLVVVREVILDKDNFAQLFLR